MEKGCTALVHAMLVEDALLVSWLLKVIYFDEPSFGQHVGGRI